MSLRTDIRHGAWVYRLNRNCGVGRIAAFWRAICEWRLPF